MMASEEVSYPEDGHRIWDIHVTRYIGTSKAINNAAECFINCKQAFVNPTGENIVALRTTNAKAVNSIRAALVTNGPRACTADILLSICMLQFVQVCPRLGPAAC